MSSPLYAAVSNAFYDWFKDVFSIVNPWQDVRVPGRAGKSTQIHTPLQDEISWRRNRSGGVTTWTKLQYSSSPLPGGWREEADAAGPLEDNATSWWQLQPSGSWSRYVRVNDGIYKDPTEPGIGQAKGDRATTLAAARNPGDPQVAAAKKRKQESQKARREKKAKRYVSMFFGLYCGPLISSSTSVSTPELDERPIKRAKTEGPSPVEGLHFMIYCKQRSLTDIAAISWNLRFSSPASPFGCARWRTQP